MKNNQPQLLTYYSAHCCSAEDTQGLYLGFEELKPVLSLLNRIQTEHKKILTGKQKGTECLKEVDSLYSKLDNLLFLDMENQIKKEKNK